MKRPQPSWFPERSFAASLSLSVAFGVILGLSLQLPALAVTCVASGGNLNTVDEAAANGRGNRAINPGMQIYNDDVACARVSSLFVTTADGSRWVEVGWFEDPAGGDWDFYCLGTTSGSPRLFAYTYYDGLRDCYTGSSLTAGQADTFTVRDPDQNGVWTFGHGGSNFWTSPNMGDFNSGKLETNGERSGDGSEPARAEFGGLQRMDAGQVWQAWTSPYEADYSDDPDFHDCIDASDHVRVIRDGNAC